MDELACPRCRLTKYRNPSMKLMINVCGHALCEACTELIFTRESAPCPECGKTLRKSGFRAQLFEDTRVDKEVDIRKSILRVYNKQECDFETLKEYNDYLEEVEDIIWNLESGRDEKETREKVARYKQENEVNIRKIQVRINQERSYAKEQMIREAKDQQRRVQILNQLDKEAEAARKRGQEDLLNELTYNTALSTAELLAKHRKIQADEEKTRVITDDRIQSIQFSDIANQSEHSQSQETDFLFKYDPMEIDNVGPDIPSRSDIFDSGYLKHVREATGRDVGGGYNSAIACQRAINDAFSGLFFSSCKSSFSS